jgi:HAD superfamily phosphatase (TIGR01668 family)
MNWESHLQPNLVLDGPVIQLTPDILKKYGLKGLVLDVDETLVPIREIQVSPEVSAWIEEVRQVSALWLVSNNISQSRIAAIASALDLPYIFGARKPSRRKVRQALERMQLPSEQVAMVGDRLFTDVLVGNRLGMFSILVEPMVGPTATPRLYSLRNVEVAFSQWLGVSLGGTQQNLK